jgi:hypothetical protein
MLARFWLAYHPPQAVQDRRCSSHQRAPRAASAQLGVPMEEYLRGGLPCPALLNVTETPANSASTLPLPSSWRSRERKTGCKAQTSDGLPKTTLTGRHHHPKALPKTHPPLQRVSKSLHVRNAALGALGQRRRVDVQRGNFGGAIPYRAGRPRKWAQRAPTRPSTTKTVR